MDEKQHLRLIRNRLAALENPEWFLSSDGHGQLVEAKGADGELFEIARLHRGASPDEIDFLVNAPTAVCFLLSIIDRAFAVIRQGQNSPVAGQKKDFAAEAAMKCGEPAFMAYLEKRHGLERPLTLEKAVQKLRTILSISSRKELNNDTAAADRWRNLRADFDAWRKASR